MRQVLFILCFMSTLLGLAQNGPIRENIKKGNTIESTVYHDNGNVAQHGYFNMANDLDGAWISYDVSGEILAQGNYREGKRIGTWYFYNTEEINQVQYQDGRITQVNRLAKKDTRVVSQFE